MSEWNGSLTQSAQRAQSEWKRVKLGEVVSLVIDHRGKTPTKLGGDWSNQGYRALSAKSVKTRQLVNLDAIRYVDEDLYRRWMKEEIQRGDILVTSEAPYGEVFYWNSDEKIVLSQRLFGLRVKPGVDSAYVAQYMTTSSFRKEMDARATGTTVFGLRQPELLDCAIELPPLSTQRKIAAVLGALDDKIENNRKICANLEAQAQAIFKSWFVDFEPFGGKMPAGWKMGKLGDLGTIVGGATPSKANKAFYTENGIHWLTPKDLSIQQTKFVGRGETDITEAGFKSASVKLMPRGSVLFSSRAPIGYVAIAKNEMCTNQGFKSVVPNPGVGSEFVYQLLCANTKLIEERASGSTFKEISTAGMRDVPVVVPSKEVLGKFSQLLASQSAIQENKEAESRALAATRDALLPKLMSGEIEVEKVEV